MKTKALLIALISCVWFNGIFAQNSCLPPTTLSVSNITASSATLNWTAVTGAVMYQVKYKSVNVQSWSVGTAQNNSFNLLNLNAGAQYEFMVQKVCASNPNGGGNTTSAFSSAITFATLSGNSSCGVSSNLTSSNITQTSAKLSWSAVSGAAYYNIRYRASNSNTWITALAQAIPYNLGNLTPATTYIYEVQTACYHNGTTVTSAFANGHTFTTLANNSGCGIPANLASTNITSNSAKLSWYMVSGASSYNIQYRVANSNSAFTNATTQLDYLTVSNLNPATLYEFKVQSVCINGGVNTTSAFSHIANFTTLAGTTTCPTPTQLGSTNITSNSAKLTWAAANGVSLYSLRYKIAGATNTVWTNIIAQTNFLNLTGLNAATQYEFQVQSVCNGSNPNGGGNTTSAFTSSAFFTTLTGTNSCAIPTNLATSNLTHNSAKVSWNAVNGAISYNVKYKALNANTYTYTNVTTNFINFTNLNVNTLYELQVQTVCTNSANSTITSAYSVWTSFTTLNNNTNGCGTPVNLNVTHLTLNSAKLNWSTAQNAHTYQVKIKSVNTNANWVIHTTNNNYLQLTGLNNSTAYEWHVQSVCLGGNVTTNILSNWSAFNTFSTPQQLVMGPNPANNVIEMMYHTNNTQNIQLNIVNAAGKSLVNSYQSVNQGENKLEVNSTNLENGLYFIEINGTEGKQVKKVYVQHY